MLMVSCLTQVFFEPLVCSCDGKCWRNEPFLRATIQFSRAAHEHQDCLTRKRRSMFWLRWFKHAVTWTLDCVLLCCYLVCTLQCHLHTFERIIVEGKSNGGTPASWHRIPTFVKTSTHQEISQLLVEWLRFLVAGVIRVWRSSFRIKVSKPNASFTVDGWTDSDFVTLVWLFCVYWTNISIVRWKTGRQKIQSIRKLLKVCELLWTCPFILISRFF